MRWNHSIRLSCWLVLSFLADNGDLQLLGQTVGFSVFAVPSLLDSPAPLLARQWKKMYTRGMAVAPALAAGCSLIWGTLAVRGRTRTKVRSGAGVANAGTEPADSSAFALYTAAAVLIPSFVPYTMTLMSSTNRRLLGKAESMAKTEITDKAVEAGVAREETTHALVDKWATLNMGRALLVILGTLCGVVASVNKINVVAIGGMKLAAGADRMG
jgi:hypothetical protein